MIRVAITGCDGCGKSTVLTGLTIKLIEKGYRTCIDDKWDVLKPALHPITASILAPDLPNLKKCISKMEGPSRALFLLWLMSTSSHKAVQDSNVDILLHDGYWMKHLVAEIEYGNCEELLWMMVGSLPVPQLTIMLDAPVEETLRRKLNASLLTPYECGRDDRCEGVDFILHQQKLRKRMNELCDKFGWIKIDGDRPRDEVVLEAFTAIEELVSSNSRFAIE